MWGELYVGRDSSCCDRIARQLQTNPQQLAAVRAIVGAPVALIAARPTTPMIATYALFMGVAALFVLAVPGLHWFYK